MIGAKKIRVNVVCKKRGVVPVPNKARLDATRKRGMDGGTEQETIEESEQKE